MRAVARLHGGAHREHRQLDRRRRRRRWRVVGSLGGSSLLLRLRRRRHLLLRGLRLVLHRTDGRRLPISRTDFSHRLGAQRARDVCRGLGGWSGAADREAQQQRRFMTLACCARLEPVSSAYKVSV